ncbi:hypothetical protein O181_020072 [Austropuccinia psidii MF-1]|uniref:Uncharacterized protein n=1 Tax=Austropuccinia psidii MF-1 TaxID=1389203 RepID=A0A9Q3GV05_9BASI|nr:hypothetical protein [Austropuccinia psidii MF-1]
MLNYGPPQGPQLNFGPKSARVNLPSNPWEDPFFLFYGLGLFSAVQAIWANLAPWQPLQNWVQRDFHCPRIPRNAVCRPWAVKIKMAKIPNLKRRFSGMARTKVNQDAPK